MIPGQLGDPVDQFGYPLPEAGFHIFERHPGNVFHNIVQKSGRQQHRIFEVHLSDQDFGHRAGMAYVGGPGFSPLTGVQLGGKLEGFEKKSIIGVCGVEASGHAGPELGEIEEVRISSDYRQR
jgi:hypothetical protein